MSLRLKEVHGAGASYKEYLRIEVLENCDLSGYAVVDSTKSESSDSNIFRHCFFFPTQRVCKGDVIFLYTKPGSNGTRSGGTKNLYDYYWGSKAAIWNDTGDTAILIKYSVQSRIAIVAP